MTAEEIRSVREALEALRGQLFRRLDDIRDEAVAARERHHDAMNHLTVALGMMQVEDRSHAALSCHPAGEGRIQHLERWRAYLAGAAAVLSVIATTALALAVKRIW